MINTKRTLKEGTKKVIAFNQHYLCKGCNNILPPSFQIDHIIPFSLSQNDDDDNLQALCPNCHSLKTQREISRISHFKKLYDIRENCWFCLEKDCNQTCTKIMKKIEDTKKKHKNDTMFDTICDNFRYGNKNTLNIEICLYNCCIYVNNVICRMNKDDVTIENVIDAVFLATRSKKFDSQYNIINIEVIPPNTYDKEGLDECVTYINNTINVDDIPERILKKNEHILLLCFNN
jgi:hypothetical protein